MCFTGFALVVATLLITAYTGDRKAVSISYTQNEKKWDLPKDPKLLGFSFNWRMKQAGNDEEFAFEQLKSGGNHV
ncbi:MAG: hypothetical protein NTY01_24045 [Verrucomicrobia bacterium]|nr:hypothetical protein [Verrucomicrobiota bacterium]